MNVKDIEVFGTKQTKAIINIDNTIKVKIIIKEESEKKRIKNQPITRNIAKSGEELNWCIFSSFQLNLGLIGNHSQSTSCHIAIR